MVDLTARINKSQWESAINVCKKALMRGWLTDGEQTFVRDMVEEYELNGDMMEPSRKQFEWLKQIAYENRSAA